MYEIEEGLYRMICRYCIHQIKFLNNDVSPGTKHRDSPLPQLLQTLKVLRKRKTTEENTNTFSKYSLPEIIKINTISMISSEATLNKKIVADASSEKLNLE